MADRRLATHADHDLLLLAAWASGDTDGSDGARAADLAARCPECRRLADDLRALRSATRALPTPARPRDFRLTPADAERLRSRRGWLGGLLAGRPGGFARPMAAAMTALGLAGLLFSTLPPLTAPTTGPEAQVEQMRVPGLGQAAAPSEAPSAAAAAQPAASADTAVPELAAEPSAAPGDAAGGRGGFGAGGGGQDTAASVAPLAEPSDRLARDGASQQIADARGADADSDEAAAAADTARPALAVGSLVLIAGGIVLLAVTRSRSRRAV